jgi:hypothetical protein
MIWAAIFWYSAGSVITGNGRITASEYVDSLGNQLNPMVQMLFPNNNATLQEDNSPIHTARSVQSWFEEHEDALQHFPWLGESTDLNTIEPLLSVLESRVRSIFPPPPSLKQLEGVLHKERYNIPLEIIQIL